MSLRIRKRDGSTASFNPLSVLTDPAKARAAAQSIRKKSERKPSESSKGKEKKDEADSKPEEKPVAAEETKKEEAPGDLQKEPDKLTTGLDPLNLQAVAEGSSKEKAQAPIKGDPRGKTRAQPMNKKPLLGISKAGKLVFGPRFGRKDEADGDPRWPGAEATDADFEDSEVPYSDNVELNPIQFALVMQLDEEYDEARYVTLAGRFFEETGIRVSGEEMRRILDRRSSK